MLLSAPAASASSVDTGMTVTAGPGEQNVVTVTQSGATFTITDAATITAGVGSPCTQDSATQVTCTAMTPQPFGYSAPGIRTGDGDDRVTLNLSNTGSAPVEGGDGNDVVDASASTVGTNISGGAGTDTIIGSPRQDIVNAGAGDDTVTGNDGHDFLKGGSGADVMDGGEGDDLIITLIDPAPSDQPSQAPGFNDDNEIDTVTCGGNLPPAALIFGEPPRNPRLPPTDVSETGVGDLVGGDCEEIVAMVSCPSGSCSGVPTITGPGGGAGSSLAAAAKKGGGKRDSRVLGEGKRKVKIKGGSVGQVHVEMDRKKVQKALKKRDRIPATLQLASRGKGKAKKSASARKIRFKLKK